MKCNIPERVMRDIAVLSKEYGIRKVILFGSRARGTHTDRSDIDIAISGGNTAEFSVEIDEKVHTLLMFDVVDLDGHISAELQKEIERDGIVIYEKIDSLIPAFEKLLNTLIEKEAEAESDSWDNN